MQSRYNRKSQWIMQFLPLEETVNGHAHLQIAVIIKTTMPIILLMVRNVNIHFGNEFINWNITKQVVCWLCKCIKCRQLSSLVIKQALVCPFVGGGLPFLVDIGLPCFRCPADPIPR